MTFLPYFSTETAIFCGHDRFCPMRFSAPYRSSGFVYQLIHHHIHFLVQDYIHFYPSVSRILIFLLSPAETTEDHRSIPADQDGFVGQKDRIPDPVRRGNVPNGLPTPSSFYKKGRLSASGSVFQRFDAQGILCRFVFSVIQKLLQRLPSGHPPCRAFPRADPGHFFRNVRRLPSAYKSAVSGSVPG